MRAALPLLLFLAVPLVGCLGDDTAERPGPFDPEGPEATLWAERAVPFGEEHDHTDPAQHDHTTPNFEVLSWDPLITEATGATAGSHFCGDVPTGETERRLAAVHSFDSDMGFVLVDVTDPHAIEKVGELNLPRTKVYDVAVTPDSRFVVVGTNSPSRGEVASWVEPPEVTVGARTVTPTFTDACLGTRSAGPEAELPLGPSVLLVDVNDPASPTIVDVSPQPILGVHSIFATEIDGATFVLASVTNLQHQASYYTLFTVEEGPTGPQLTEVGVLSADSPTTGGVLPPADPSQQGSSATSMLNLNGHVDGWVAKHPGTGETLVYLAAWDAGLHIHRYDGPGQLTPLSTWSDFDPSKGNGMTGQIHGAYPLPELRDGVHYTIIGQEIGSRPVGRPTGQLILLDTTDPVAPVAVARWTLPADVVFDGPLMFSTHYPSVVGETMFVSMYHGGVWAVDISPEHFPELPSIGVFLPTRTSPNPPPPAERLGDNWAPTVLEALALPNGDLLVYESSSGAYTVRFDATAPMPSPAPWVEDKWL